MAWTATFEEIKEKFNPKYWDSIDEFEEFYLRDHQERTTFGPLYYTDRNGVEKTYPPIDHFPQLKEYTVWMGGYSITGNSQGATILGKAKARNFRQACHIIECLSFLAYANKVNSPDHKEYEVPGRWDYDPSNLSVWGCSLHWSEKEARKTFG